MCLRVQTTNFEIHNYDHVLEVGVDGESGFLHVGYTDSADSRRHDKTYGTGQWSSFYMCKETVGGY